MAKQTIRIGIVGAGGNTRQRHIPGFRAIEGVELVGVVNRSAESTDNAAREFGIEKTYADWQTLVADPGIDAVLIGTWPNLHCEITCAALAAGKHVLTEARMARDAAEARRMLQESEAHPDLVAQVVPSPFGLAGNSYIRQMIKDGFLGELRELIIVGADNSAWDASKELHWRQDAEISGLNVLSLGILHETAMRWCPPTTRVFAQSRVFESTRPSAVDDSKVQVTVPDSLQIVTEMKGGARGIYHFSGIALFGPGHQIHMYGSHGTIKLVLTPQEQILIGRVGDAELKQIEIPAEQAEGWRVEAEFIGAIRGEERVRLNDFRTGVNYMEFTEAVAGSASLNSPVDLPPALEE